MCQRRRLLLLLSLAAAAAGASGVWAGEAAHHLTPVLADQAPTLETEVLDLALLAADCAEERVDLDSSVLTVIDYSMPSTEERLWVFDLERQELLFHELVSHGINTGENFARRFSNREGTRQSSLGLFRTDNTYWGRNGYSLRLHGLEKGFNHNAFDRAIVMHGAWYVSETFADEHGRLGRSWGCPALERDVAPEVIDTIKEGSLLFVYYPDPKWLESSRFLNRCRQTAGARRSALRAPFRLEE